MSVPRLLKHALAGWFAGAIAVIVIGFAWPAIFPAIVVVSHYYGTGPSLPTLIIFSILIASPGGLIGGMIGGRIPREGGQREEIAMAAIMGIIFSLPFSCMLLWFFTGW